MALRTVDTLDLAGKRVFLRVDLNVPLDADGRVKDDARIRAALPTIKYAVGARAKVILASHLGRPKGKPGDRRRLTLQPAAARLSELLDRDVVLADDCVGEGVRKLVGEIGDGQVLLLENLRFHPEEEANDQAFARELAGLCDVWVNDAFDGVHRAHASTAGMAAYVKERAAGFLVLKEVEYLGRALDAPTRPFVAVLGGARASDKMRLFGALLSRADAILVGGATAYTFLRAQGIAIGRSLVEEDRLELARQILERARGQGVELLLPCDHVCGTQPRDPTTRKVVNGCAIPEGLMGLDIGPRTLGAFRQRILDAGTVFWNGPVGLFEQRPFAEGTLGVARAMAESPAVTVVGGGDSAAAVEEAGLLSRIRHVSTGEGASLEFVEGRDLPGVKACEE